MKPGIHHGLDIETYHRAPGISKSGLDSINRSPAHFYALHLDPARPAPRQRAGQLEGTLAHCATLEPDTFHDRFVVGPAVSRATKEWKAFVAEHQGRIAIQPDQYETAWRQADSVRKLPEVREALGRGRAEVSAAWIDQQTGALCRCRPDWVHEVHASAAILLDLKTYGDASRDEFRRQVARKRYHVQDPFYSDGYGEAAGVEVLGFVFVAVEDEWPYAANALMLDEISREQGRREYRRNLNTYAACMESGQWPGFDGGIQIINLPAWAIEKEEA